MSDWTQIVGVLTAASHVIAFARSDGREAIEDYKNAYPGTKSMISGAGCLAATGAAVRKNNIGLLRV